MPAKINLLTSFYKYWGEIFMAVNIEYFLSQKYDRYELQEVLRTEELYNDINNVYMKKLFAILHQEFNRLFNLMYRKTNIHFNAKKVEN